MVTSTNGIELIKSFEGLRLTAYKAVKTEKYYTIGYGHYGADVVKGQKITQAYAEKLLKKDLVKYEAKVNKYMKKYNFNQNQFDALVSFAYNIGSIDGLTAHGFRSISKISEKILTYTKSGGKVLSGLVKRRQAEKKLFDTPVVNNIYLVFDAMYYANKYPDLREAFGYDESKLLSHFLKCGMSEGRQAISSFNVQNYKKFNPDLQIFGDDLSKYYQHYCTIGYKEGRVHE